MNMITRFKKLKGMKTPIRRAGRDSAPGDEIRNGGFLKG
jgi:hypothetical protein